MDRLFLFRVPGLLFCSLLAGRTPMPVPVDDTVALVYRNRYVYLMQTQARSRGTGFDNLADNYVHLVLARFVLHRVLPWATLLFWWAAIWLEWSATISMVDFDNPDYEAYPGFWEAEQAAMVADLKASDVVYASYP